MGAALTHHDPLVSQTPLFDKLFTPFHSVLASITLRFCMSHSHWQIPASYHEYSRELD
jgi:hypothetical protein